MAKAKQSKAMSGNGPKKPRGRTNVKPLSVTPTAPNFPITTRVEANRPVSAGAGKHRGDRRDMSKTYTGSERHAARGNNARADVKTRKR